MDFFCLLSQSIALALVLTEAFTLWKYKTVLSVNIGLRLRKVSIISHNDDDLCSDSFIVCQYSDPGEFYGLLLNTDDANLNHGSEN